MLRAARSTRRSPHALRLAPLAAACSLLLLMGNASAQTTAPSSQSTTNESNKDQNQLGTVTVTGIRGSVEKSVKKKEQSNSIVEAVSAEDIGKLPDISIAESIARLPGVTSQRVDGRGQVINIRGMSPDFSTTLLNGREIVSTGDSRSVEYDQFPAELMNGVIVYKTPDAALVGQGLAGTVDLQAIRPLSVGKRRVVFSASGEHNSFGKLTSGAKSTGYRMSASYVDQFRDNTIGVAIGIARMDSPWQEKHYKAWWWGGSEGWFPSGHGKPDGAIALQGAENWVKTHDLKRTGVMGVLEFRPNKSFHSVFDLYYTKFDQNELMRGVMWANDPWTNGGNVTYSGVQTTNVNGAQFVTGGTLHNVRPVVRNDSNTRGDTVAAIGWNNTFQLDPWTATVDMSWSRARRHQSQLETYSGPTTGQDIGFSIPLSPAYAQFSTGNFADPSTILLGDPAGWGHDGRLENSYQQDKMHALRFDLDRALDSKFLSHWSAGLNINRREKDKSSLVYFANLKGGATTAPLSASDLLAPTSLGFSGIGNVLSYDPRSILGKYYDVSLNLSDDDVKKDFNVIENVTTAYTKVDIDADLGSHVHMRGNAGVQWVRTNQSSTAFNVNNGLAGSQTIGTHYSDALPSLNLVFDFGHGWITRFGAAKTLSRAPINYLSAASGAGVDITTRTWSGGGGNPKLEPYRANAFDVSFEKYFGTASYVGLAFFHKKLNTYVYQRSIPWDFTGYANSSGVTPVSNMGTFYTWANGTGGEMKGAELSAAINLGMLHPVLDGFGATINGSYTKTSIKPNGPDSVETDTLPGLSKIVANGTVYYERRGFSIRLSERYRSSYRGEYSYLFGSRSILRSLSERQLDFQTSYEFGDNTRLHGLSILFQVNNITNTPYRTVQDSNFPGGLMAPQEYTTYGRQYMVGLSYKL
ncbi:TonB-dependent receptor [Solilutibacter silvestris]|uniref:TonB-Xanth-Caul: TonB-dependent receptor n=1 Tax=Solilutibacter silvestris TaxID=1645665 RepID=A0A2K1PX40_9GAMM|nr:TonB-dependent receptor [Lysobacter silvestris]PNS07362.1 TonB-Xanth-Caul: TonB-dependent receptor [Lysobacter silvestris]